MGIFNKTKSKSDSIVSDTSTQTRFNANLQEIELDNLSSHPDNFYSKETSELEILSEDLERQGLKQPLVVTKRKESDPKFTIISGHRRYAAIRLLHAEGKYQSTTIPCYVEKFETLEEEMQSLIMLNATARELTDKDKLAQYHKLKEIFEIQKKQTKGEGKTYGRIRDKIAKVLGVSSNKVAQLEIVDRNASPEVKQDIISGKTSVNKAYEKIKKTKDEKVKVQTESIIDTPKTNPDDSLKNVSESTQITTEPLIKFLKENRTTFKTLCRNVYTMTDPKFDSYFDKLIKTIKDDLR